MEDFRHRIRRCGASPLRTWCLTPRKPLFFRPQAPRLSDPMGLRRHGRGASLPAIPYSFVRKHHVPRSGWADALTDVVLHTPQSLVSSSRSTKALSLFGASTPWTWCKDSRKTLFFRFSCTKSEARMGRTRTKLEKGQRSNRIPGLSGDKQKRIFHESKIAGFDIKTIRTGE